MKWNEIGEYYRYDEVILCWIMLFSMSITENDIKKMIFKQQWFIIMSSNELYKINNDILNVKREIIKTIKKEDAIRFKIFKDGLDKIVFHIIIVNMKNW